MDALDSNLREGREMDILYHELVRTIPKDYLDIESVSTNQLLSLLCVVPNLCVHLCMLKWSSHGNDPCFIYTASV